MDGQDLEAVVGGILMASATNRRDSDQRHLPVRAVVT